MRQARRGGVSAVSPMACPDSSKSSDERPPAVLLFALTPFSSTPPLTLHPACQVVQNASILSCSRVSSKTRSITIQSLRPFAHPFSGLQPQSIIFTPRNPTRFQPFPVALEIQHAFDR